MGWLGLKPEPFLALDEGKETFIYELSDLTYAEKLKSCCIPPFDVRTAGSTWNVIFSETKYILELKQVSFTFSP